MLRKIGRLFVIKTRFEACLIIYALALGAIERGTHYIERLPEATRMALPAHSGEVLFLACMGAVFLAGAKIFDAIRAEERIGQLEAELEALRGK